MRARRAEERRDLELVHAGRCEVRTRPASVARACARGRRQLLRIDSETHTGSVALGRGALASFAELCRTAKRERSCACRLQSLPREVSAMKQQMRLVFEPPPETSPPSSTPPVSREQLRSRRRRAVRAKTTSMKRLTKRELRLGRALYPDDEFADVERPKTRADCKDGPRPCPFVSCVHHLYLDVSAKSGAIKVNFPDLEPWELGESCSLDVADRKGTSLENVGAIMNLTRERIRQLEVKALAKVLACEEAAALRDFWGEGSSAPKRRLPLLEDRAGADQRDDEDEDAAAGDTFDAETFAGDELDDVG
jgi:hypothetical protein